MGERGAVPLFPLAYCPPFRPARKSNANPVLEAALQRPNGPAKPLCVSCSGCAPLENIFYPQRARAVAPTGRLALSARDAERAAA